jgi:hypothetical protein
MPLPEEATLYIRIWTGQKCLSCGCEFRYVRRFVVPRTQTVYSDTQASVEAAYTKAATETAEVVFPCPQCGYIQPDMVGTRKAVSHGVLTFATFFLPLVTTITAAFDLLPRPIAAIAAASVASIALVLHLHYVFANPNRDRLANLTQAQQEINKGMLRLLKEGGTASPPIIPKPTEKYLIASAILVLAITFFAIPAVTEFPFWLFEVAGICLFIWSGSTFANAALLMKKLANPRDVVEINTTLVLDETVPEDFQKKKKKSY